MSETHQKQAAGDLGRGGEDKTRRAEGAPKKNCVLKLPVVGQKKRGEKENGEGRGREGKRGRRGATAERTGVQRAERPGDGSGLGREGEAGNGAFERAEGGGTVGSGGAGKNGGAGWAEQERRDVGGERSRSEVRQRGS